MAEIGGELRHAALLEIGRRAQRIIRRSASFRATICESGRCRREWRDECLPRPYRRRGRRAGDRRTARIAAQELRKQWCQQETPHQGRRTNADAARRRVAVARQRRLDLPELTKDRLGALVQMRPSSVSASWRVVRSNNAGPEMLLQCRNLPADRGQGTWKRSCGGRQAARIHHPHKGRHGGELVHGASFPFRKRPCGYGVIPPYFRRV